MLADVHAGQASTEVILRHWRHRGDRLFEVGQHEQAAAAYEKALDIRPEDAYARERFKLASVFDKRGVALSFDAPPTIVGGIQALYEELTYPEEALRMAIEGRVVARVVVRADGTLGSVEVLRGLGHGCDAEVQRVLGELEYAPAQYLGRPVPAYLTIPVQFKRKAAWR
jgi:TonB family protein